MGTALKHFNYGSSTDDTHNGFVISPGTREDLLENDVIPFASGIAAGNQMVMVTHNTYTDIDEDYPASLSPAIYAILRTDMGFNGMAVTDSLSMNAITSYGRQASLLALKAGADIAMVGADYAAQIDAARDAVQDGSFAMDDVKTRVLRVLCWKIEHGILGIRDEIDIGSDDEAVYSLPGGAASESGSFDEM